MEFFDGQTFVGSYPPEAAAWCNTNHACITMSKDPETGIALYKIQLPDPPSNAELYQQLRDMRNARIEETDYLVMPDYPIDADTLAIVLEYRAALRNLPQQEGAPWDGGGHETPWPVKTWETGSGIIL